MAINRPLKTALSIGVLLGVLGALVVFGGLSLFETQAVQSRLQNRINRSIPGSLHWKSLNLSLLRGRVVLKGLELKDPQERHLAGFDRLEADLSWLALLSKNVVVEAFVLDKPTLRLSMDTSGALNLLSAFPPSSEETEKKEPTGEWPANIIVKHFQIDDADIVYRQAADSLEAALYHLSLALSGNYKERKGELEVSLKRGHIARGDHRVPSHRVPLTRLFLQASLEEGSLAPFSLELETGKSRLEWTGAVDSLFNTPVLHQTLQARLSLPEWAPLAGLQDSLTGELSLYTTANGPVGDPSITLDARYGSGVLFSREVGRAGLHLSLNHRIAQLDSLHADLKGMGTVRLQGVADLQAAFPHGFLDSVRQLDSLSYALNLHQYGLGLNAAVPDSVYLKGKAESFVNITGRGVAPKTARATVDISSRITGLTALEKAEPQNLELNSRLELSQGMLTVDSLRFAVGKLDFLANGTYNIHTQKPRLSVSLKAPELGGDLKTLGVDSLAGSLNLQLQIAGSLKNPDARLELDLDSLAFKTTQLGNLKANAHLKEDGSFTLSRLSLQNQKSHLRIRAEAEVLQNGRPVPVDSLSYSIAINDARVYLEDFLDSLSGEVTLALRLQGRGLQPKGSLQLKGRQLDLGAEFLEAVHLNLETEAGDFFIRPLRVTLSSGEFLELRGSSNPWIRAYDLLLETPGISVSSLKSVSLPDSGDAKLSLRFSGKGDYDDPRLEGSINLEDIFIHGERLQDVRLKLDVDSQVARLSGDPGFDLKAGYHLKTGDFSVSLLFRESLLTGYLKLAGQPELEGILTGGLKASGNTGKIDDLQAAVDLQSLELNFQKKPLLQVRNSQFDYQSGRLELKSLDMILLEEGRLTAGGTGSLKGPFQFTLKGDIPLEVVRPFAPDLYDMGGNLHLEGRLEGTPQNPDYHVKATFKDVELTIPTLLQKLHTVNGSITADANAVEIPELRGKLEDGDFHLKGEVQLQDFQPGSFHLDFRANNLPLKLPGMLNSRWDVKISGNGGPEQSSVTGNLTLLEGLYYKDIAFNLLDMRRKTRKTEPGPPEEPPPFLKNMSLNIDIHNREDFKVDNNMAKLSIQPDLTVSGHPTSPALSGRATIRSGRIYFQKREFVVTKGYIDFLNPYAIEPTLYITSQVAVRDWNITLKLEGTPDNLQFGLSSTPTLEDEDIISLLVTGKTAREVREGQLFSGGGSTGQMLKKALAGVVEAQLKSRSGLDEVTIETKEEEGSQSSSDVKVTLGKQLTRRLATKYQVETEEGEIVQKAIAEYKILESLLMSGFQDTEGVYGGEIQVYLEFR